MTEAVLKLTSPEAKSATIPDDRLVYRANAAVNAVFKDDVWDLSPTEMGSRSASLLLIDFTYISHNKPAWKLAAKELAYHRLNTKLSPVVDTIQPYTCAREQVRLKRFIRWLDTYHPDIISPAQVTQGIVHSFRVWLETHEAVDALAGVTGGNHRKGTKISPFSVWTYMSPIKSLDLYRGYLTEPIGFSPYGGQLSAAFLGVEQTNSDNKTPPIADEVLHPLVTVALRYVDHYWRDIQLFADERRATWAQHDATGRTKFGGSDVLISTCPELGMPWREPFGTAAHHVNHEFRAEMGNLISACSTIVLYMSGMRPREFCSLPRDCLHGVIDPIAGTVVRWRVRGMPAKKKLTKRKPVEWIVPEPAARAIKVLQEVLQPFRERRGSDLLVMNLDALQPKSRTSQGKKTFKLGLDERSLSSRLNDFLCVLRTRYGYAFEGRITPSQFRRTLARHIARQPYGIIAGKLQYHHVKTSVFEGYAGSSADGFRLEVADEELLAHVDLLEELRQEARDGYLLGPGAASLVRDYDAAVAAEIGEAMVDTSPTAIAVGAATKSLAKRVHVGALNYCIWGTAKAMCLSDTEAAEKDAQPNINMCSPDRCGNSVIGRCHIPRWFDLLGDVEKLMTTAKTTPQRVTLKDQAERYQRLLKSKTTNG